MKNHFYFRTALQRKKMYQISAETVAVFKNSFNVYVYDSTEPSVLPLPDQIWKNSNNILNMNLLHLPHPFLNSFYTDYKEYIFFCLKTEQVILTILVALR